jgi:hypothetical protein
MAILAVHKACGAYKRDKAKQPVFRDTGAIAYDPRILSFKGRDAISILTLDGRIIVPIVYQGRWTQGPENRIRGQADLIHRDGMFFLAVVIEVPDLTPDGRLREAPSQGGCDGAFRQYVTRVGRGRAACHLRRRVGAAGHPGGRSGSHGPVGGR